MAAMTALLGSEKGLVGLALIIAATVLAGLGHMTIGQWTDYTMYIFGIYVVGKTVQGVGSAFSTKAKPDQSASTS